MVSNAKSKLCHQHARGSTEETDAAELAKGSSHVDEDPAGSADDRRRQKHEDSAGTDARMKDGIRPRYSSCGNSRLGITPPLAIGQSAEGAREESIGAEADMKLDLTIDSPSHGDDCARENDNQASSSSTADIVCDSSSLTTKYIAVK